ncbi:MAG: hypothetical protein ACYCUX_13590 [Metallibacterium sp.]
MLALVENGLADQLLASAKNPGLQALNLTPHDFHGEWNYAIAPKRRVA